MDQLLLASDELMVERLADFLTRHPPSLDDILGSACEVYRVDPGEIRSSRHADAPARHAYCYLAVRWSRASHFDIGLRVGFSALGVDKAFKTYSDRLTNALVRDDLDLIGVRIAERILMRRRLRP